MSVVSTAPTFLPLPAPSVVPCSGRPHRLMPFLFPQASRNGKLPPLFRKAAISPSGKSFLKWIRGPHSYFQTHTEKQDVHTRNISPPSLSAEPL